ncbi:unnamed protein product [Moneuplotes crassus]|uniref:Uncharacterized protein n=1 Tax=Euplotes crassus TaxID=5936 RepID=A0AAD1XGG8_EUPCR|nr:unnamed protein product [Moneuplotes crassus]
MSNCSTTKNREAHIIDWIYDQQKILSFQKYENFLKNNSPAHTKKQSVTSGAQFTKQFKFPKSCMKKSFAIQRPYRGSINELEFNSRMFMDYKNQKLFRKFEPNSQDTTPTQRKIKWKKNKARFNIEKEKDRLLSEIKKGKEELKLVNIDISPKREHNTEGKLPKVQPKVKQVLNNMEHNDSRLYSLKVKSTRKNKAVITNLALSRNV